MTDPLDTLRQFEGPGRPTFSGADVAASDKTRLTRQMAEVLSVLKSTSAWLTVSEIRQMCFEDFPEPSTSAQVRICGSRNSVGVTWWADTARDANIRVPFA
jgi:hypothetical protein